MKFPRLIVILFLLWPIAGALGLVAIKEHAISSGNVTRVQITGYDPRHLMYGHYLRFRFTGAEVPDQQSHDYYIPEQQSDRLNTILMSHSHEMAINVRKNAAGEINFGELYIDNIPWHEYLNNHPQYKDKL